MGKKSVLSVRSLWQDVSMAPAALVQTMTRTIARKLGGEDDKPAEKVIRYVSTTIILILFVNTLGVLLISNWMR